MDDYAKSRAKLLHSEIAFDDQFSDGTFVDHIRDLSKLVGVRCAYEHMFRVLLAQPSQKHEQILELVRRYVRAAVRHGFLPLFELSLFQNEDVRRRCVAHGTSSAVREPFMYAFEATSLRAALRHACVDRALKANETVFVCAFQSARELVLTCLQTYPHALQRLHSLRFLLGADVLHLLYCVYRGVQLTDAPCEVSKNVTCHIAVGA